MKNKPYKTINLKDYAREKFIYDYGDFWFETPRLESLKEMDQHNFPKVKFPKNFTEEEQLECINTAYHSAEEQSYMDDYIAYFHQVLLSKFNNATDKVEFEYEHAYWDEILLNVYYGVEFLTEEVKDDDGNTYSVEQWLENGFMNFDECIKDAKRTMENYQAYDRKIFDEVYLERIEESIAEIKDNKLSLYRKVRKIMKQHLSNQKKAVTLIKLIQGETL